MNIHLNVVATPKMMRSHHAIVRAEPVSLNPARHHLMMRNWRVDAFWSTPLYGRGTKRPKLPLENLFNSADLLRFSERQNFDCVLTLHEFTCVFCYRCLPSSRGRQSPISASLAIFQPRPVVLLVTSITRDKFSKSAMALSFSNRLCRHQTNVAPN